MSTYLGWPVVACPSTPWPAGIEVAQIRRAAANTNPFSQQQQIQDWNVGYKELSVSIPSLTTSAAAAWVTFFEALNGLSNVFQFPSSFCLAYPNELTSDGTTPRYWRLRPPGDVKWSIKPGGIYHSVVFEVREAF